MNAHLAFLLCSVYEGSLAPAHLADLRKSGLTDETIQLHGLRSVPPTQIGPLLGWDSPRIQSAYLIPYPSLGEGGWLDHVCLRLFPPLETEHGTIKYAQPRRTPPRLYLPRLNRAAIMDAAVPLWVVEGQKKALALAQVGLAAVGIAGVEGWHVGGSRELLPEFAAVPLRDRVIEVVPDGDYESNPDVNLAIRRLADALRARGARPRRVVVPIQSQESPA
jgi:putative DNA primase/helicase